MQVTNPCKVTRGPKGGNLVKVEFRITVGEVLALRHALDSYHSPVGGDVRQYLLNAIQVADIDPVTARILRET